MKFLLDHDIPERIADVLQQAGHLVSKLREGLPIESDDAVVLQFAQRSTSILVTCNRDDFLALASEHEHCGIIILVRRKSRIAECSALLRLVERAGETGLGSNINRA